MNFEVGDWLLSPEDEIIELLELDLENGVHNKIKKNGSESLAFNGYLKQCRKWKPKSGDWCWFLTVNSGYVLGQFTQEIGNGRYRYKLNTSDNALFNCSNCEPFIGDLPSRIKKEFK